MFFSPPPTLLGLVMRACKCEQAPHHLVSLHKLLVILGTGIGIRSVWKHNKLKLLGHILRSSPSDPLNQVTFGNDNLLPRPVLKRRAGRPRADWVLHTYQDAFQAMNGPAALFDENNTAHFQSIKDRAILRQDPF